MRFRIACRLLCKRPLMALLLAAQLTFALVVVQISVGRVNMARHSLQALRGLEAYTGFYVTSDEPLGEEILGQLQGVHAVSRIGECYLRIDGRLYCCLVYDEFITRTVAFPVAGGQWLTGADPSGGSAAPVVSVGDDFTTGAQLTAAMYEQEDTFPVVIQGVLAPPAFVYWHSTGGTYVACSHLYAYARQQTAVMPMLLADRRLLSFLPGQAVHRWQTGTLIVMENDAHYDENRRLLANHGSIVDIPELFANERAELSAQLNTMAPILILTFLLSLAGLFGMGILALYANTRQLAIYTMVGASRRDIARIGIWYMAIPSILAALAAGAALFVMFKTRDLTMSILWESSNSVVFGISASAGVLLPVAAMQAFLRRFSPIRLFHQAL